MSFLLQISMLATAVTVIGAACSFAETGSAAEVSEMRTNLDASVRRIERLQAELSQAETKLRTAQQGAATSVAEGVMIRANYERLRSVVEGLGLGSMDATGAIVRDRHLQSLSDLKLAHQRNLELENVVRELIKSVGTLENQSEAVRGSVSAAEIALAKGGTAKGFGAQGDTREISTRVLKVKGESGMVVIRSGGANGMKVGSPVSFARDGNVLGEGIILEVRDTVCGVLLTGTPESPSNIDIKEGDEARLTRTRL